MLRKKKLVRTAFLMEIGGEETVVIRVETPHGPRWFNGGGEEYTSREDLAEIRSQLDKEHLLGPATLYEIIKTLEGDVEGLNIPEKVSDLENDSGYQTESDVNEAVNEAIATIGIPTKVSDLENDSEFQTKEDVENAISEITIPTKVSDLENDSEYQTKEDVENAISEITIPSKVSDLENDSGFQTKEEVDARVQEVVGAAPEALDTLEEIAAKLADDDDVTAQIVNSLTEKATKEEVEALTEKVDAITVPTKVSELENDSEYQTKTEVEEAIAAVSIPTKTSDLENDSDFITTGEVDEKFDEMGIYNLGNYDTLEAMSEDTATHTHYNNTDHIICYFTIANTDMGIFFSIMGDMVDGLPYTSNEYMYYQKHRYTRTVSRQTNGDVYYTNWVMEDNTTLNGKGVDFYKLSQLTTEASDEEIQDALTFPNGDGVVTADDLAACEEKGMFLREYNTNAQLVVGRTISGSSYTITYVGYPIAALSVDTTKNPVVTSVVLQINDGVYSIVKAANTDVMLTENWEKYPLEVKFPFWTISDRVYSESTILGWFGCSSISEFKEKAQNTGLLSFLYLNSGDMYYRIPVQFVEFRDDDNQIYFVSVGLDMTDDSAIRMEVTINMDGTVIEGESNVKVVKEKLVLASALDEANVAIEDAVSTISTLTEDLTTVKSELEDIKTRLSALEGTQS